MSLKYHLCITKKMTSRLYDLTFCHPLIIMIVVIAMFILALPTTTLASSTKSPHSTTSISDSLSSDNACQPVDPHLSQTVLLDPEGVGSPTINGKSYVLYDVQSNTFLLGCNQDVQYSPASITKVMTILLALENLEMTDTITVTKEMYSKIPNDYVRLGIVEGEVITVEEAIYACLLISANDTAMALAIHMGGTVDAFVSRMNARASELGCLNTHFTNPYGYADPKHLTTAHDMALIMSEALKLDLYSTISTSRSYAMPATNKWDKIRGLVNGNRFIAKQTNHYDYYVGGKTGYTDLSGYTIVAGAKQNERLLIGVILGATMSNIRYDNLRSLFDYGFNQYRTTAVNPSDYEAIRQQAIDHLTSTFTASDSVLTIASTQFKLQDYVTTTKEKAENGYHGAIDLNQALIHADQASQVLHLPLFREYADGSNDPVGTLDVTIRLESNSKVNASSGTDINNNIGTNILRVVIFIVAALILLFALFISYCLIQRRQRRRRRRKKPKIRRIP